MCKYLHLNQPRWENHFFLLFPYTSSKRLGHITLYPKVSLFITVNEEEFCYFFWCFRHEQLFFCYTQKYLLVSCISQSLENSYICFECINFEKKSCIQETMNLSTDANRSSDTFLLRQGEGGKFLCLAKKILSASFLTPAEKNILVLLSASVERFGVSRIRDIFNSFFNSETHISCTFMMEFSHCQIEFP